MFLTADIVDLGYMILCPSCLHSNDTTLLAVGPCLDFNLNFLSLDEHENKMISTEKKE